VPLLLIAAQDDPFVPFEAIRASDAEKNPAIEFCRNETWRHCGLFRMRTAAADSGRSSAWWSFAPACLTRRCIVLAVMPSLPAAGRRSEESFFLFV